MVDLRESQDFALHFSQFYNGEFGHSAYVEYSHDQGTTWEVIETMSPNNDWNSKIVDLSSISGPSSEPVMVAFHGDDNGDWASGWAVDNVEIKNGPAPVLAYYVFLDNVFEAQTGWNETTYTFPNLTYGVPYEACVVAVYECGVSEPSCTTWESIFLQAPRNLSDTYLYGTNEVPLMWNPPMTGGTGKSADFSIVYEGPNQSPFNNNSDAADSVTIIDYEGERGRNMGDLQFSFPNAGTGEAGCETDGEFIYTAQWNGDNYFKYDLAGNLLETFTISGTSGVRDMAWDGVFFYGAAANSSVFVMDFTTHTLVTSFTAPTDVRAIAFNHLDNTFYANNWGTDIICFDVNGTNLGFFTPGVSAIYGLAFDNWSGATADKYLWAYDQGENNLSQYLLPLGTPTGLTINVAQIIGSNELAGGLFTHPALYDEYEVTLGGNAQNDIVWALEIAAYSGGPTGTIPDGLASFNLYRDGVNIANIPYDGQGVEDWITYIDNGLAPNPYIYNVSAQYDLDIFGFPGETAESAMEGPDSVNVVWGSIIPFVENWDNGTFTFQNWTFNENSANWVINSQEGEPEPAAEFTWDPLLENDYTATLSSYPIIVDYITEGDLFLTFDLKLVDRNSTGNEKMLIEIYDGTTWHLAAEFSNAGKFGFSNNILIITQYATGNAINIRFNASGQNSFDIISWFVDNISVYRECIAPTDLTGEPLWDPLTNEPYIEICWDAQDIPVSIINNTLVIEKINETPTVDNNTLYRSIAGFNVYRKVMNETEYELYDVVDFIDGQTYYCYNDGYPNINLYNGYYYKVTASYTSETDMCESSPAMALEIPYDDYVLVYFEGVDDNSIIQHIAVYPNPAKDNVYIRSTLLIKHITVTNYVGQTVFSEKINGITNYNLYTSSYKQGIYLISVETENGTTTKRMIINR